MSDAINAPARNNAFTTTKGTRTAREMFDLSHAKHIPLDFGQLIPTCAIEMIPGDTFNVSCEMMVRFQAMLYPEWTPVWGKIYWWFVPNRLLWPDIDTTGNNWEGFITGGKDGLNAAVAPRWNVSSGKHDIGSLWDFLGFPTWSTANNFATAYPDATQPLDFKKRAYNLIWNEWYRDETLQNEIDITTNEDLKVVAWAPDYFTKALPFQQRGTAPAFPISGTTSAVWPASVFPSTAATNETALTSERITAGDNKIHPAAAGATATAAANTRAAFNANTVDLSTATTFTMNDFRTNAVVQQLLELNARGGVRYTEFLQAVYGCHPEDYRLQRPEFIGATKTPAIIGEIPQNSANAAQPTPQGNLAGHGIMTNHGQGYIDSYTAKEHGYIMALMHVTPVPMYQQGIPKSDARVSKYDWFHPQFVGLSEQAVLNQEIYLAGDGINKTTFGYQAIYNEYRYERNTVHGILQTTLSYQHLGRKFSARPNLNESFITLSTAELADLKRIFAVTGQPGLLATVYNNIHAIRPMPAIGEPGLLKV